jgi:hypothetical protein
VASGALIVSIWTLVAVKEVHVTFNSRMDAYIQLIQKSSKAEGVKEEQDRDKIPN